MIRTPLEIIIEIVLLIIVSSINTLLALIRLLGELFSSLMFMSAGSFIGFIIAVIIGGLFILFFSKFLFKESISLVKLILIFGGFVFILVIIFYLLFSVP